MNIERVSIMYVAAGVEIDYMIVAAISRLLLEYAKHHEHPNLIW